MTELFGLFHSPNQLSVVFMSITLPAFHQLDPEGEPEDPADPGVAEDGPAIGLHVHSAKRLPDLVMALFVLGDLAQHGPVFSGGHQLRQPGMMWYSVISFL
jgi:hypothetical protein